MDTIQRHDIDINGQRFTIRTGKADRGWWWECPPYKNWQGHLVTREDALADARREIARRQVS